jgi:hypothetical protein
VSNVQSFRISRRWLPFPPGDGNGWTNTERAVVEKKEGWNCGDSINEHEGSTNLMDSRKV